MLGLVSGGLCSVLASGFHPVSTIRITGQADSAHLPTSHTLTWGGAVIAVDFCFLFTESLSSRC